MAYVTCPNCGVTLASTLGAEPPSACPDCCSKLTLDAALAGPPPREPEDVAPIFETVVVTGRDAPRTARQAFASFCSGLDGDVAATGALLVSEVVTNAVLHGPADGEATIALHFATVGDVVQVEVSDEGPGFEPVLRQASPDAESGRGLQIVEALAESWGVDHGRPTRVWFELPAAPSSVATAS